MAGMNNWAIRQHALQTVHKEALRAYVSPGCAATPAVEADEEHDRLLHGVPQPRDWLVVCRAIWSPVSFRAASLFHATSEFMRRTNNRIKDPEPRALAAMLSVMAEVERKKCRDLLRASSAVTILMDDRKEWRLIQARVSHKSEDGSAMASSLVLLAMVRNNGMHDKDLMEVDKDFGERVVSSTNDALRRLCRLPDGQEDEALLRHIYARVMTLVSDGCPAALKALRCHATSIFPSVALIIRDACHAIRIATKEPLGHLA
ncbi:unnamed protein product [Effrenium voratum]|nr:unnamed protein product [Effrenium voratum]